VTRARFHWQSAGLKRTTFVSRCSRSSSAAMHGATSTRPISWRRRVAEDPLYRLTNCRSARRMKRDTGVTVQRVRVGELWREGVTDGGPMMTDDAIGRRDAMHQRRDVATCSSVHSTPAMQSVTPHPCLALNTTVIGLRHAAVTTASSTNTCA